MAFTWVPFYKEFAQKLLQFRNDRQLLIDWVLVEMDVDDEGKEYCAWLNDGTKVEFDLQGEWKRVSRNKTGVPARLVPPVITEYVKANYPQNIISKLSKKLYSYKIELSDDMDLRFDPQGNFIEEVN